MPHATRRSPGSEWFLMGIGVLVAIGTVYVEWLRRRGF